MRFPLTATLLFAALLAHAQMRCDAARNPIFEKYEKLPITDGWFEVYKLPGGVFALWEPRQSERVFSYLIVGEKKALLFDSGFGIGRIDEVVRQLTALPVIVLNSHTHYDHVGGNYAFPNVLGTDSDYTRNSARGFPNSKMAPSLAPGQFCPPLPAGVAQETYVVRPFKVTQTIHDGDLIDLGGRTLEVLATPGHTPDAVCLLDRSRRELFTGDTFYPGNLWLWVPETDLDAYRKSIERIAKLAGEVDVLRPAHILPEADPKLLAKVSIGLADIRSGKMTTFTVRNGRRNFQFDGFSIQLADH